MLLAQDAWCDRDRLPRTGTAEYICEDARLSVATISFGCYPQSEGDTSGSCGSSTDRTLGSLTGGSDPRKMKVGSGHINGSSVLVKERMLEIEADCCVISNANVIPACSLCPL